jgi:uncharacterized protein (TIGR03083 family)
MKPVEPILTVELFPPLSGKLIGVLKSLEYEDWEKPTACAGWSVKDVTAHLLGGDLGRLSERRIKPSQAEKDELSFEQLVKLIDKENDEWVRAARRISPRLLVEFLELTDPRLYQHCKSLRMEETARTPVSWAGESQSPNWMDIAREYTEKWLHQQHIREAVGKGLLTSREWLFPVLDTILRALPHTYRTIQAEEGSSIGFHIDGEAGGDWCLLRQEGAWHLYSGKARAALTLVRMDQDLAWRLFTKGISPEAARPRVHIEGDRALGEGIMQMVSIMA